MDISNNDLLSTDFDALNLTKNELKIIFDRYKHAMRLADSRVLSYKNEFHQLANQIKLLEIENKSLITRNEQLLRNIHTIENTKLTLKQRIKGKI